ncbi:replication associated protein [Lake Sarah-associated circular virus-17]|uniref:replication associated protein n=1 Tax=Lake Sarah-associated circular virus-17 TaxID=1685743 RepID=UPI000777C7AA|nr:replication associated protein [Lake Sarah-associated circular virus-17]ALE29638.1 replication associated protein [Lake Sarah-associated circular virus-17]ALE29641.1 replication associated protein [Lake Sarah-associated circular virus-17]ALE29642.1 replication associated protein [Lake Sarah-associated circular virus-17]
MANPTRQNARHWIVTQHDIDAFWRGDPTGHHAIKYLVFQVEQGAGTSAWHIQGFIQFKTCVRGSVVQRLFGGNKPHVEVAHHPSQAREYCMKEDTQVTPPEEFGTWEPTFAQGYRSDLTVAKLQIRQHGNYRRCLDDDALDTVTARYPKWVADQLTMVPRPLRPIPIVTVYYGPTNTGKTARCHINNPGIHEIRLDNGFINYTGQSCVLFDEFDKDPWPFGTMLKLLDRYPFQINVKNGYSWWEATHIFITATEAPCDWYLGKKGVNSDHIPQFLRRLTNVVNTTGSVLPPPLPLSPPTLPVPPSPEIEEQQEEATMELDDPTNPEDYENSEERDLREEMEYRDQYQGDSEEY